MKEEMENSVLGILGAPAAEDSNQGAISVGEHNINSLDLKWWRAQIGLVQQEPFLFNDTIFNNISFGLTGTKRENASDELKRELVEKACREAFAEEFIKRLPEVSNSLLRLQDLSNKIGL